MRWDAQNVIEIGDVDLNVRLHAGEEGRRRIVYAERDCVDTATSVVAHRVRQGATSLTFPVKMRSAIPSNLILAFTSR